VRSLIALSFFAACAAIVADNTLPVAPVKPVQDNLSIRKSFASDQRLLRMAVVRKYWMRPLLPAQPYLGFDGDGALDLFVPHRNGGQSIVLWNDGRGHFSTDQGRAARAWIRTGAAGDLDGGGRQFGEGNAPRSHRSFSNSRQVLSASSRAVKRRQRRQALAKT
jgi:hypothetical protein